MTTDATRTEFRTCPLCEATCGLEITLRGDTVTRIRGDRDDVFSKGFICPKGSTLRQLEADPDRLRSPQIRAGNEWRDATWDEAFAFIAERLSPIIGDHGGDSVAVYLGNPNVHNLSGLLYGAMFLRSLRTKKVFSAATVDQMPKHVSSGYMFGHPDLIPVPDIDRTDYLLMLGADPYESNGSLATAPNWPGRLDALQARGGRYVVVDPRRSKTAGHADEHVAIRPGTDALLLAAIANTLVADNLLDPNLDCLDRLDEAAAALGAFTPERVGATTGVAATTIRRIANDLATAPTAVVYGRMGTHTVRHGTVSSWLVDLINALTGNLDRPGGAMFPRPAHERPRKRRAWSTGRWTTRVRGLPEVRGELPVSALAEEIDTPGDGRVRALVVIAGNPVLSTPNAERLDAALDSLELMISIDLYRNETSRRADVILPATSPLQRSHYDLAFGGLMVRNVANYSAALVSGDTGLQEWEVLARLSAIAAGQGPEVPAAMVDDFAFSAYLQHAVDDPTSRVHGRDPAEITAALGSRSGPERYVDFLLRAGPYGDRFGEEPNGLTLATLEAAPHGIDLGPLEPRLPDALVSPGGTVDLAPAPILADLPRLEASIDAGNGSLLLVGRRHVRSNNSWMHNIDVLVKGRDRCTLLMHPDDASAAGLDDGAMAEVASAAGKVVATTEVSDTIMPGVVSLPHGWGHDRSGAALSVAARRPGVNTNILTDETDLDPLSGNATLNGIPVTVTAATG